MKGNNVFHCDRPREGDCGAILAILSVLWVLSLGWFLLICTSVKLKTICPAILVSIGAEIGKKFLNMLPFLPGIISQPETVDDCFFK